MSWTAGLVWELFFLRLRSTREEIFGCRRRGSAPEDAVRADRLTVHVFCALCAKAEIEQSRVLLSVDSGLKYNSNCCSGLYSILPS